MAAKSETLRLLVLHNSADNTEEIVKSLKNAGTPTRPQLLDNLEDFEDSLNSQPWDLVLAGEDISGCTYMDALQAIRNRDKDIPLIVLLKTYDENVIVEALEAGAVDAIVFDQHQHVVFCIRREIKNLYHRRIDPLLVLSCECNYLHSKLGSVIATP